VIAGAHDAPVVVAEVVARRVLVPRFACKLPSRAVSGDDGDMKEGMDKVNVRCSLTILALAAETY
jgi:hypothetical protein